MTRSLTEIARRLRPFARRQPRSERNDAQRNDSDEESGRISDNQDNDNQDNDNQENQENFEDSEHIQNGRQNNNRRSQNRRRSSFPFMYGQRRRSRHIRQAVRRCQLFENENVSLDDRIVRRAFEDGFNNNMMDGKPPKSVNCPITGMPMQDPIVLQDGMSYERAAIERWLKKKSTSPVTGEEIDKRIRIPNHMLRNTISELAKPLQHD